MKFEKLHNDAIIPEYQTVGSVGMDLHSIEDVRIPSGERLTIRTGLAFYGESGFEAQVRPRSGLAAKHGITIVNSPGTIDSDYTGEIKIILLNTGSEDFTINIGDRIAQMVICPVHIAQEFMNTEIVRGTGGFGSTGT